MSLDDTPPRGFSTVDWRSVAARVAMADGAFYLLSTEERDALEVAVDFERLARDTAAPKPGRHALGSWCLSELGSLDPMHGNSGPGGPLPGER